MSSFPFACNKMFAVGQTWRSPCCINKTNVSQKGVKHMYENGIKNVPKNYILPTADRPEDFGSGSETKVKLPVIDFAELQGVNRSQAVESLAYACQKYGFFQLVNHGIEDDTINNMVCMSKSFFDMPISEREKYMSADTSSPVRYGTSFNQTKDDVLSWRDFLKLVCHPQPQHETLSHWPSSPLGFRQSAATYANETRTLFVNLAKSILESLGLADSEAKLLKDLRHGSQLMILNCYPPCPQPNLTLGMPPHSDYGFLTLLLQDHVEGLQIQHQHQWITVKPVPGSFVVNVGDHLEIISNGRYKSVLHRVVVNSVKHRISVASLHSVPFTSTVRPAAGLLTEANPKVYKDTDFSCFLDYITSCDSRGKNFLQSRKLL